MTVRLSIVVASGAGGEFIFRCLDSLGAQTGSHVEIIVVDRCGGEVLKRIEEECPFVTVVKTEPERRLSVPELRSLGAARAQGEIVAIIEEHCVAPSHWVQTVMGCFRKGDAAIGGPILDSDFTRVRDWVVYFSEYHNYLPPWQEGERYLLNGANVAYGRQKLMQFKDVLGSGYWEVVLHPRLAKEGAFRSEPSMGVHHTGPFDYGYYLEQRYLLSRVWGGMQKEKVSFARRLVYLLAAPVFPILLLARITHRVAGSRGLLLKYLSAFPLLIPVSLAYVLGEWTGYLRGVGSALERVE